MPRTTSTRSRATRGPPASPSTDVRYSDDRDIDVERRPWLGLVNLKGDSPDDGIGNTRVREDAANRRLPDTVEEIVITLFGV
jgi:hypothetical protein